MCCVVLSCTTVRDVGCDVIRDMERSAPEVPHYSKSLGGYHLLKRSRLGRQQSATTV